MSPLRWTCKSTRALARELKDQGFQVGSTKVAELLKTLGYSLQSNRKTIEGKQHPDRNAQFEHIARRVKARQRRGEPAISIDTKKKEPLGKMKNPGKTYRRKGKPIEVKTHDFPDKELGKAVEEWHRHQIVISRLSISTPRSYNSATQVFRASRREPHLHLPSLRD